MVIEIEFERFEDAAKKLPVPDVAYSYYTDDPRGDGRNVIIHFKERNVCLD